MKTRVTPSTVEIQDLDGRRLRALISAETLDRENEVLVAAGAELDNYRRNPVHSCTSPQAFCGEPPTPRALWAPTHPRT